MCSAAFWCKTNDVFHLCRRPSYRAPLFQTLTCKTVLKPSAAVAPVYVIVDVSFQRLLQIYTKSKRCAVFMNANLHAE